MSPKSAYGGLRRAGFCLRGALLGHNSCLGCKSRFFRPGLSDSPWAAGLGRAFGPGLLNFHGPCPSTGIDTPLRLQQVESAKVGRSSGAGSKSNSGGYAGFRLLFCLPGLHLGPLFVPHTQLCQCLVSRLGSSRFVRSVDLFAP